MAKIPKFKIGLGKTLKEALEGNRAAATAAPGAVPFRKIGTGKGTGDVMRRAKSMQKVEWMTNGSGRMGTMASWMGANLKASAGGGWGAVAKQAGMSALKGAMVGGVVGGTTEAMQGGSFWEGAKEGAWNGGIGFAAARSIHRATGATGFPLGKNGAVKQAWNMWGATSRDAKVSKPAMKLLTHKSMTNATKAFTTRNGG